MLNTQGARDLFPHLLSFPFFTVASYAVSLLNAKRDCHQKKIYSYIFHLSIYCKFLVRSEVNLSSLLPGCCCQRRGMSSSCQALLCCFTVTNTSEIEYILVYHKWCFHGMFNAFMLLLERNWVLDLKNNSLSKILRKRNSFLWNKENLDFINLTKSYHDWCVNFKASFQIDQRVELSW